MRSAPMTSASRSTARRICLREAPIVRSVASSRVRCATVIDIVLKMTKAPTKRATRAEGEQEVADEARELADLAGGLLGLLDSGAHLRASPEGSA